MRSSLIEKINNCNSEVVAIIFVNDRQVAEMHFEPWDITYDEIYTRGLKVMDLTATTMCKENNLPIYVFNMDIFGNLKKVMEGEEIGTLVHN